MQTSLLLPPILPGSCCVKRTYCGACWYGSGVLGVLLTDCLREHFTAVLQSPYLPLAGVAVTYNPSVNGMGIPLAETTLQFVLRE